MIEHHLPPDADGNPQTLHLSEEAHRAMSAPPFYCYPVPVRIWSKIMGRPVWHCPDSYHNLRWTGRLRMLIAWCFWRCGRILCRIGEKA